jgi:hypothetical protein
MVILSIPLMLNSSTAVLTAAISNEIVATSTIENEYTKSTIAESSSAEMKKSPEPKYVFSKVLLNKMIFDSLLLLSEPEIPASGSLIPRTRIGSIKSKSLSKVLDI